jgi:hypothetical protein
MQRDFVQGAYLAQTNTNLSIRAQKVRCQAARARRTGRTYRSAVQDHLDHELAADVGQQQRGKA